MPHERRVFFESGSKQLALGEHVLLSKEDSHHLVKVLRLKVGAMVIAVSKQSSVAYEAVISKVEECVELKLISEVSSSLFRSRVSCVYMALLKNSHLQTFIEQASELGTEEIVIFAAERSVAKLNDGEVSDKVARWQRVAEAAAKQSGQVKVPDIQYAKTLTAAIRPLAPNQRRFTCSLSAGSKELRNYKIEEGTQVQFAIGPEGDFTSAEEALLSNAEFLPVTLGPIRLRAEMAGIAAIVSTNAIFGYIE